MKLATQSLKTRYELTKEENSVDRKQQLQPMLAKIEIIESEIERLRERIQQGNLVAPATGKVTNRSVLTGESVSANSPVIEILENNSTEAILFVQQERIARFDVGKVVELELAPFDNKIECEVIRLSDQMESPPAQLAKHYAMNCVLLPVYMKPLPEYAHVLSFRINSTVKLPINYETRMEEMLQSIWHALQDFRSSMQSDAGLFSDGQHENNSNSQNIASRAAHE